MRNINNPYAVAFGRIPTSYISRDTVVDEIVNTFNSEYVDTQCFKLTGIRGCGKTVTMTDISAILKSDNKWIAVDLSSSDDLVLDLIAILYDKYPFLSQFIDSELNLSALGIGIKLSANKPVASIDIALSKILNAIKSQGKRLLITIDEIIKSKNLVHFIKLFQQLVRENLPIYLIAAGLHGKIEDIENTEGLTFFLRAPKIRLESLNLTLIRSDYQKKLGITREVAEEMAYITKGYAFAYQALGKYMWESEFKELNEDILLKTDAALADGAYKIIWRELSDNERFFLSFICQKDSMDVSELLSLTKKNASDWSRIRKNLIDKEIITVLQRGCVAITLPRFNVFIESI